MARKLGLSSDDVLDVAAQLADERGLDALTLAAVAAELGVRSPSLYAHVEGLAGLRRGLTLRAASAMATEIGDAADGHSGIAALREIAIAYRRFAHRHPGLYSAAQHATGPDTDEEVSRALGNVIRPVLDSLREIGIGHHDGIHLTRALRSGLHGFVALERQGGFGLPASIEDSFHRLVNLLLAGISAATPGTTGTSSQQD